LHCHALRDIFFLIYAVQVHVPALKGLVMERIFEVGMGFWASKTLLTAVEMGLFTELAKSPGDLASVAGRMDLHPRSARDFLDALVALGFLERNGGIYRNTVTTDFFLDKQKSTYVGGVLEMASVRLYPFWANLTTALRTGQPQSEVKDHANTFEQLYAQPERLEGFLRAMTGISTGSNRVIAANFPWKNYKTAADIGTAQGDLMVQVALANAHIAGIGFDLPQVGPIFSKYVAANDLSSRVKFEAGSFFSDPLPKADVLMMGHILHDWNLEEKKLLIRKAYEALEPGGALIVYESIIDDDRSKNAFGLLMSLNMLIETPGGFDYTGADCSGWMKEAGFRETRVEKLLGPDSMVVGIK
jgi:hypothetical protein